MRCLPESLDLSHNRAMGELLQKRAQALAAMWKEGKTDEVLREIAALAPTDAAFMGGCMVLLAEESATSFLGALARYRGRKPYYDPEGFEAG